MVGADRKPGRVGRLDDDGVAIFPADKYRVARGAAIGLAEGEIAKIDPRFQGDHMSGGRVRQGGLEFGRGRDSDGFGCLGFGLRQAPGTRRGCPDRAAAVRIRHRDP